MLSVHSSETTRGRLLTHLPHHHLSDHRSFDEGEEEEDEWDGFEAYDEEDNEEAILFGFLDEGNLQQPQLSKGGFNQERCGVWRCDWWMDGVAVCARFVSWRLTGQSITYNTDEGDDDIEMVAGPANNTFFTAGKADPWVMVEKGEASDVAMGLPSGRSTRPPTPGPKEGGDGETNGRRSRMDVKIQ